jgi:LacI family transcriptional regulator
MKNIRQIAKLAGVSHSTVSRVLNGSESVKKETRERVEKVMAEQGYKPNIYARGMLGESPKTLGVVIPNVMDPFFSTVISSIERVCRSQATQLLIAEGKTTPDTELEAINYLLNKGCDRLLVHTKALSDEQLAVVLNKSKEIYLINRAHPAYPERCSGFDNYVGGGLAAKALIGRGRVSVAIVTSSIMIEDATDRLQGFIDELHANDISLSKDMIFSAASSLNGGTVAARSLLTKGAKFDAVFCYNDIMAAGVIQALQDNGVNVPADVSVVGFDDLEIANYLVPRLSTIRYPVAEMAEAMTQAILQDLNGDGSALASLNNRWQPVFVSRESH